MRIKSLPHLSHFRNEESGIKRVVEAYTTYLSQFDIEVIDPNSKQGYDLLVCHAGMGDGTCDISHLHGMYWTADYDAPKWEYDANRRIVNDLRVASQITVPSNWVAKTLQRDMRINPHVIGHGIEWQDWQHALPNYGYVLWNKNRTGDVCSPKDINLLAGIFSNVSFVSTFGNGANIEDRNYDEIINFIQLQDRPNFITVGLRNHIEMRKLIQQCGVYLSTTKETFGIGILEAMAAGKPILGYAHGGNLELVQHGINGYLARDFDDLVDGLSYCLTHHKTLGDNSREIAKDWTWVKQVEKVAEVYRLAMQPSKPDVSVVIPVYNKPIEQVKRAIDSCLSQTLKPFQILVIDDGSDNDLIFAGSVPGREHLLQDSVLEKHYIDDDEVYFYFHQENQGVAITRNFGISMATTKYVCCLDADDWIDKHFLQTCVEALESDPALHLAYTGLTWHKPDGSTGLSEWPGDWNFNDQLRRKNQVPTCCVFTRESFDRLGGYRQRYAPTGAGSEDAELWTRMGAYGFKAAKVSDSGMFHYSWQSGHTSQEGYSETDWLAWHPWAIDGQHPFASYATPIDISHPVRQYDNPVVSVIIPVGPGHEHEVINALDSLEAQAFRLWEVVVVWDCHKSAEWYDGIKKAYPYIRDISSCGGAGYARNRGVEIATAPLILFLDADDTLHPDALTLMIEAWNNHQKIVYTDYAGHAFATKELTVQYDQEGKLESATLQQDGKYEIITRGELPEFDCHKVLRQPEPDGRIYHFCNISCLLPKVWHNEIGGFDESLDTWEDLDYWYRHVFNGKCFHHLRKPLMRYKYHTGQRRNKATPDTSDGLLKAQSMIKLLRDKYAEMDKSMACTGCGGSKPTPQAAVKVVEVMSDDSYVKAKYTGSNGNHWIMGSYRMNFDPGVPSRRIDTGTWIHKYGYGAKGFVTYVHVEDIKLMVGKWERVPEVNVPKAETPKPEPVPIKPPSPIMIAGQLDLQTVPGITDAIATQLQSLGLLTKEAILAYDLSQIKGVGATREKAIREHLKKL